MFKKCLNNTKNMYDTSEKKSSANEHTVFITSSFTLKAKIKLSLYFIESSAIFPIANEKNNFRTKLKSNNADFFASLFLTLFYSSSCYVERNMFDDNNCVTFASFYIRGIQVCSAYHSYQCYFLI